MFKERAYRLTIEVPEYSRSLKKYVMGDPIIITELQADISVIKDIYSFGGISTISLYKLQPETADYLVYDRYLDFINAVGYSINADTVKDNKKAMPDDFLYPRVTIEVGYENELVEVLRGIIQKSSSPVRQGSNLVTTMQIVDSGFYLIKGKLNSESIILTSGTTTLRQALDMLSRSTKMYAVNYKIDYDNLGVNQADLSKVYSSSVKNKSIPIASRTIEKVIIDIMNEFDISDFNSSNSSMAIIDDRVSFLLNQDVGDYLNKVAIQKAKNPHIINKDSGLLQPPSREGTYIRIDLGFNPYIAVGDRVEIESDIITKYNSDGIWTSVNTNRQNGQYVVQAVQHSGTFSKVSSGQVVTTIQLFTGGIRFANKFRD